MCLILPFFIANVEGAITIGDTTFPADVGDVFAWEITRDDSHRYSGFYINDWLNFTTEAVYQGQHGGVDVLIVNYSSGHYNAINSRWTTTHDNIFYLAANKTQNYLNISSTFMSWPIAYVIPTPINLSAVGLALSDHPNVDYYELKDSKKVFLHWVAGKITYKLTFHTSGILTRYGEDLHGMEDFIMLLRTPLPENGEDGDGGGAISFGYYFLIFALISIVALVYLKKKNYK
ncbi:MAG: hypothetical protein ACFFB8_15490 [Promethearchaeota archaeon]